MKAQGIYLNTRARLIQKQYKKYKAKRENAMEKKKVDDLISESPQEPIKSITDMSTFL